jgi:hypothetical protein
MGNEIIGKIQLEGASEASSQLQKLQKDVDGFNKGLRKNQDAVRLVDQLTGGMVTQFRTFSSGVSQSIKALKGLNLGLKGMKSALIATGIGAFVVALGTVVAYWDEIVDFITGASKEQQRLNDEADRTLDLLDQSLGILEQQIALAELRGEDASELVTELRKELLLQQEILDKEIERRQLQLDSQKEKDKELTFWEKAQVGAKFLYDRQGALLDIQKFQTDESEETVKKQDELNKLKSKTLSIDQKIAKLDKEETDRKQKVIDDIEKKKLDAKKEELARIKEFNKLQEQIDDALIVSKADKRAKERDDINKHYDDLIFDLIMAEELTVETELALNEARREKLAEQQTKFDEEDQAEKDKENEEFMALQQVKIDEAQKELDAVKELEDKKQKFAQDTLDNASRIAGEETKLGKTMLVAKQLLAAKEFLISIGALKQKANVAAAEANLSAAKGGTAIAEGTAETAKIGFPQNILPLIAYAATAAGIISSIKSAVTGTKKAAAEAGGSAGGSTPTPVQPVAPPPPAFNIVGTTETSQLAETITGQTQQPIQAYVVSNDVTTAQSLERNIVQGATIG